MQSHVACLALTLLLSLVACGDDGGVSLPDARMLEPDAPKPCTANAQYGSPTASEETATRDADTMPESIYYESVLNADLKYDVLEIGMFKGFGAFEVGEIEPKLIQLINAESGYETCGACVLIYGDVDPDNDYVSESTYLAVGGTLNLAEVSPNVRGMLLNTRLVEVSIDPDTDISTPLGDCSTEISSFQFDFPVTTEPPMFTSKRTHRLRKHR